MNRMLMIFRKDVAHLWPQIVAFLATLVAFACNDPTYTKHEGDGEYAIFLGVLLPLACWLLVTSLFQDEGAVGREPYWLHAPLYVHRSSPREGVLSFRLRHPARLRRSGNRPCRK